MKTKIILLPIFLATSALAQEEESAIGDLAIVAEDLAADATLYPVPDYTGNLWEREAFTGDWGGLRTALAEENGLQFSVDVNQFYQGIWDGGRSRTSEYNGSADYRVTFDSGKSGLWPGGFLDVHGETYWGRSVNDLSGAILPVNTDPVLSLPAGEGTYLSHVVYTQFLAENFAVFLGKIDTASGDSNRFAHGVGDQKFMNLGFSFNPVSLKTTPYSTLGAGFLVIPTEGVALSFSMYDADGTIDLVPGPHPVAISLP